MPPQPPRGGPRQRLLPTPRGVNMIVWSLDNRFVLAAIMGKNIYDQFDCIFKGNVSSIPNVNQNLKLELMKCAQKARQAWTQLEDKNEKMLALNRRRKNKI